MATSDTQLQTCDGCGATIYPEHLERHAAERVAGKLFCTHCIQEKKAGGGAGAVAQIVLAENEALDAAPELAGGQSAVSTVRERAAQAHGPSYRRALLTNSPHATRCRTFHCKLTDASISHMDHQVNEWIDQHDDVEVKFATTTVGVVEGKHNDPHLIVTIYY